MKYLRTIIPFLTTLLLIVSFSGSVFAATSNDSVGLTGTISAAPPTTGATITFPNTNQVFTNVPINAAGLCPGTVLVKMFKNNVFAGSVQCANGSYSIQIDLFSGTNELVARVYDDLDQAGPDSNIVNVSFNDTKTGSRNRVSITSNFAKRGAFPGETLTWPLLLSGGNGPYAVSIDWGDGTAADLSSQPFPGAFNIKHIYKDAGVYNIIIKVVDTDGSSAYLQLVGVGNGPLSQTNTTTGKSASQPVSSANTKIIWQPALIIFPFIISTFWLGKRYAVSMIKRKINRGEQPFAN